MLPWVKNTLLHEGVNLQLRAEMFNIFNRLNLANPSGSFGDVYVVGTFDRYDRRQYRRSWYWLG